MRLFGVMIAVSAFALSACGGSSGPAAPVTPPSVVTTPPTASTVSATVSGAVVAGAASCELDVQTADGSLAARGASGADGTFEVIVTADAADTAPTGAGRLLARNCAYSDEYTGDTIAGQTLSVLFDWPDAFDGAELQLVATPLTRLVDLSVSATPDAAPRETDRNRARDMTAVLSRRLLGSGGALDRVVPAVSVDFASRSANASARDYGLALAAVSAMGDLDGALQTLAPLADIEGERDADLDADMRSSLSALVDAAAAFERSGRNASGHPATLALSGLVATEQREFNRAPLAQDVPTLALVVGDDVAYDLTSAFTDPDGDGLDIHVSGLPAGLLQNASVLTGRPVAAGRTTLMVTAYDGAGAGAVLELTLSITDPDNLAPVADIAGGNREGEAPLSLSFDGTGSSDADGRIVSHSWAFGDGASAEGDRASHVFSNPGTYTVRLVVTDDKGGTASATRRVIVEAAPNRAPVAVDDAVMLASSTATRDVAVMANDTDPDGDTLNIAGLGDVGAGLIAEAVGRVVRVTGVEAGTWSVTYALSDGRGGTDMARLSVTVPEPDNLAPVASINGTGDREGVAPFSTFLNGRSSSDPDGEIVAYDWDLGNGDTSVEAALNYTYEDAGDYLVTLTVTDDRGATASASRRVVVSAPATSIAMPIEVLGTGAPDTTTIKSRSFQLASAAGVDRLSLTCHRCDYRDSGVNPNRGAKASFRINGGAWVDVTDELADVAYPEVNYGGIKGAYHTVRFTLPVSGLVDGENSVDFRFNGTDGFSNGYRIIAFNALGPNGPQFGDDAFVWDDPAQWVAQRNSAEDIQRGSELWNGRVALLESPLSTKTLRATCADCHASDGSDLKYFNYSNETITVRAQFHGLSALQGERIASYIRALDTPAPAQARPWNPPYQPGPGLDLQPVEEWAAGAGLGAVLDRDADMLGDLFPNGTATSQIAQVTSTRNTLNVREQRIALQLPDWKMWLPEVHPKDLWGEGWETLHNPDVTFDGLVARLKDGGAERMVTDPDSIRSRELLGIVNDLGKTKDLVGLNGPEPCKNENPYRSAGYRELIANGFITQPASGYETDDGVDFELPPDIGTNPDACETWMRSVAHWMAVKEWELHTRFRLEDAAPALYPYGEARSWLGDERAVFGLASHRTGNDSALFRHLTRGESSYISHAWYQLQVILNAGNRDPRNHRPPDWKYQMSWMWANRRDNDVPSSLRYVQTLIKMQQNLDMRAPTLQPGGAPFVPDYKPFRTDRGPTRDGWWTTTHVGPQRFVSIGGSFFNIGQNQPTIWTDLDSIASNLRVSIQDTMLRDYLDKTLSYEVSAFPRGTGQNALALESAVPTPYSGSGRVADSNTDHNQVYRSIPMMRDFGMSETQIARLIDWGEQMWPLGDWDALRTD